MDQNTYNKKILLGLNPFDNEKTILQLSVNNIHLIETYINLRELYRANYTVFDWIGYALYNHQFDINNFTINSEEVYIKINIGNKYIFKCKSPSRIIFECGFTLYDFISVVVTKEQGELEKLTLKDIITDDCEFAEEVEP